MKSTTNVGVMRLAIRAAILAAGLATLGACASIPQRAWANGQAMTSSRAYRSVMSGNTSIQSHHELMWSLDPVHMNYREAAYSPFGQWWY